MTERTILTREQVEAAERREGITHPIIDLLEKHEEYILDTNKKIPSAGSRDTFWGFYIDNFGFLADELEEIGEFSVEPLDLIAIWSKTLDLFHDYQRYAFSRMLSAAYVLAGNSGIDNKGATRFLLENDELPAYLLDDPKVLMAMRERFDIISRSLKDVDFYVNGIEESAITVASRLAKLERDGDVEAGKRLQEMIDRQNEFLTPVLDNLHENFGNGMVPLRMFVSEALEDLVQPPQ